MYSITETKKVSITQSMISLLSHRYDPSEGWTPMLKVLFDLCLGNATCKVPNEIRMSFQGIKVETASTYCIAFDYYCILLKLTWLTDPIREYSRTVIEINCTRSPEAHIVYKTTPKTTQTVFAAYGKFLSYITMLRLTTKDEGIKIIIWINRRIT